MTYGVQQGAATAGRTVKILLLMSCACLLAGPPLLSQGVQEEPEVVEEASPVRPEELVSQTEQVREQVRQILAAFEDDSAYLAIENALVASTEQVSAQAGEALSRIEGASSLESLNTILVPWAELQEQAREWDRSVASRILNDRRASLLTLQQQISQHLLTISPMFEEADRVQARIESSVLTRDVDPIWLADWGELSAEKIEQSSVDSLEAVSVYVSVRTLQIALHLIFLLLCVWMVHRVASAAHRARERGVEIGGTEVLLSRPISAAVLVGMLPAAWFYPLAPDVFRVFTGLIFLFPVFRLLPLVLPGILRSLPWLILSVYLLQHLRQLWLFTSLLPRLLLLAEGMLLGAGLLWLLTSSRKWGRELPPTRRWLLKFSLLIGVLAVLSSILSNLLGNLTLSELLIGGTYQSGAAAALLYVVYLISESLLLIALHSQWADRIPVVSQHSDLYLGKVRPLLKALLVLAWIDITLQNFRIRTIVLDRVSAFLAAEWSLGSISISIGDPLAFGLTLLAAFLLSRLIRFFLNEAVLPKAKLPRGIPYAVTQIVHYTILSLGFLMAVAAAGFGLDRLALLAGAFGVGIGFGLQNVVNNFVSGIILLFERPVQVGDLIELGNLMGHVQRIGIRSSTVRTFAGSEVIVPNGDLISNQVVNWSLSDQLRRVDIPVGVAHGSDAERVQEVLLEVAASHPNVLDNPQPTCFFMELGVAIDQALRRAGVQIALPQRDVHLRFDQIGQAPDQEPDTPDGSEK